MKMEQCRVLVPASLVAVLVFCGQAALAQNNVVVGAGTVKCTSITKDGSERSGLTKYEVQIYYLSWTQAYLTALSNIEHNLEATSANTFAAELKRTPATDLAAAIAQACKNQPLADLRDVTFQLYRQLGGRRFAMS